MSRATETTTNRVVYCKPTSNGARNDGTSMNAGMNMVGKFKHSIRLFPKDNGEGVKSLLCDATPSDVRLSTSDWKPHSRHPLTDKYQSGTKTKELLIDSSPLPPPKFGDLPPRGETYLRARNLREATPPHKHRITDSLDGSSTFRAAAQQVFYSPGNGNGVADAMKHHVFIDPTPPPPPQTTYSAAIHKPASFTPEKPREFRSVESSLGFPMYQGPAYAKDWTHREHDHSMRSPRSIHHAVRLATESTGELQQKIANIVLEPRPGLLHTPRGSLAAGYPSGAHSGSSTARYYGSSRGGAPTVITAASAMSWDPQSPVSARNHSSRNGSYSARSMHDEHYLPAVSTIVPTPPAVQSDDILRNFKMKQLLVKEMRKASDRGIAVQESREQAFVYDAGVYR